MDIGGCVASYGIKKLMLINSHGGNVSVLDTVTRELRIKHNMLVFNVNWFGLGMPEGVYSSEELKHGIHATALFKLDQAVAGQRRELLFGGGRPLTCSRVEGFRQVELVFIFVDVIGQMFRLVLELARDDLEEQNAKRVDLRLFSVSVSYTHLRAHET